MESLDRREAISLANSDFVGLHQQHAAAWASFNQTLRILVVIATLPWIVAGTLGPEYTSQLTMWTFLTELPSVVVFTLVFTAILGIVGHIVLVHNRSNIILFARALNGLRAMYATELPAVQALMPTDPTIPKMPERGGIMRLLFCGLGGLNAFYLGMASLILFAQQGLGGWAVGAGIAVGLIALGVHGLWYQWVARRTSLIAGWDPSQDVS